VQKVRPAKAAVVLQPMTELAVIVPPYDDPDDDFEFVDIDRSQEELEKVETVENENIQTNHHMMSSLLSNWISRLWPWGTTPRSDENPTTNLDLSTLESCFLKTKLSCILRLQEDVDSPEPFSCRISRSVLSSGANKSSFFALLKPVPSVQSSKETEDTSSPHPILVKVCEDLLDNRIYLPSTWIKWQGVEVGSPIYLESLLFSENFNRENVAPQIKLLGTKHQELDLPAAAVSLGSLMTKWHVLPGHCPYQLNNQLFEVEADGSASFVFIPPDWTITTQVTANKQVEMKWDKVKAFHAGLTAPAMSSLCHDLHDQQLAACLSFVSHSLQLNDKRVRPCHLLVTGDTGVGKTTFLQRIATHLAHSKHAVVSHLIKCVLLKGKRPEVIRKKVEDVLVDLHRRQPALLLLDGLDSIVPAQEEADGGDGLSAHANLALSFRELLCRLTEESAGVVVIATASSVDRLHPELRPQKGSVPFLRTENLQNPTRDERHSLVKPLFGTELAQLSDEFLRASESFTVGDLKRFAQRVKAKSGLVDGGISEATLLKEIDTFIPLARWSRPLRPEVRKNLSDVGALSLAKTALLETLVWPTTYEAIYKAVGVRMPRGILLYGVPGTGKTLLAESVASSSGLNYIPVKGPELLSKYIGASEANVRDVFQRAATARPCLIFFDEFESLAPRRGHDSTGVTDRVVNQLLTQLDGVEGLAEGVYILAATSRPDLVDPALLRPGRLDKSILCPMPGEEDRLDILR
jgi:SpoVK/Ycf46/Vps4 family AAA+-type ATPase